MCYTCKRQQSYFDDINIAAFCQKQMKTNQYDYSFMLFHNISLLPEIPTYLLHDIVIETLLLLRIKDNDKYKNVANTHLYDGKFFDEEVLFLMMLKIRVKAYLSS